MTVAMSFSTFEPFSCNREAVDAVLRWAARVGGTRSPLVLVGPSGVGKTHLVQAGLALAEALAPGGSVLCSSAADFMDARIGEHRGLVVIEHLEDLATRPQSRKVLLDLVARASSDGLLLTLTRRKGQRPPAAILRSVLARFPRAQVVRLHRPTLAQHRRIMARRDYFRAPNPM